MTKKEQIQEAIQRNEEIQNKLENLLKQVSHSLDKAKEANKRQK